MNKCFIVEIFWGEKYRVCQKKTYTHFKKGKKTVKSVMSHGDASIHLNNAIFWANVLLHIATVMQFNFEK